MTRCRGLCRFGGGEACSRGIPGRGRCARSLGIIVSLLRGMVEMEDGVGGRLTDDIRPEEKNVLVRVLLLAACGGAIQERLLGAHLVLGSG
jgi:hypothetical protein